MKKMFHIYPLLFALFAPLALLAHNIEQSSWEDARRSILATVVFGMLVFLILRLILRSWEKGAIISLLVLVLVLTYGHIYDSISDFSLGGYVIGRHRYLIIFEILVFGVFVWKIRRSEIQNMVSKTLFIIMLGLLISPAVKVLSYEIDRVFVNNRDYETKDRSDIYLPDEEEFPDIYYIILDGYVRADVLRDIFDFDNTNFIHFLEDRGFYVAHEATSNYSKTLLSLGTSMNLNYLDELIEEQEVDKRARQELEGILKHSSVREYLYRKGYEFVAFETGWPDTQIEDADYYLTTNAVRGPLNEFEFLYAESTIVRLITDYLWLTSEAYQQTFLYPEYEAHRNRIIFALDKLDEFAVREGNYFVFAHLVAPHPPFVFGKEGERPLFDRHYYMMDGNHYVGSREQYIIRYRDEVEYLNKLVSNAIDEILIASANPPIIIIQGDHGSGAYFYVGNVEKTNLKERLSILNAYYLQGNNAFLYPSISPVNTFRVVFNYVFGTDHQLLPDKQYFSRYVLDAVDITERLLEE